MAYTLAQLRIELAKSLDSYITGTATSGTTTTVVDTDLLDSGQWADDHFIGSDIYISDTTDDGAPEGEVRYCTDFVQSTGTLTVGKAFSVAPGSGDTYEIYTKATVEELNQALMLGVKDWRFVSSDDLVDNHAEYTVSGTNIHSADQIIGVWMRDGSDAGEAYYQVTGFKIWDNAGVITIDFSDSNLVDSGNYVRIEYEAEFSQLKSAGSFIDTASVGGDLSLHLLYAKKAYYERKMQSSSGVDRDWWATMTRYTTEQIEEMGNTNSRPSSKAKLQNYNESNIKRYQNDWWL